MSFTNPPRVTGPGHAEYSLKCTSCLAQMSRDDKAVFLRAGKLRHLPCYQAGRNGHLVMQMLPERVRVGRSEPAATATGGGWRAKVMAMKPQPPATNWCEFCGGNFVEGQCANAGPDWPHPTRTVTAEAILRDG